MWASRPGGRERPSDENSVATGPSGRAVGVAATGKISVLLGRGPFKNVSTLSRPKVPGGVRLRRQPPEALFELGACPMMLVVLLGSQGTGLVGQPALWDGGLYQLQGASTSIGSTCAAAPKASGCFTRQGLGQALCSSASQQTTTPPAPRRGPVPHPRLSIGTSSLATAAEAPRDVAVEGGGPEILRAY